MQQWVDRTIVMATLLQKYPHILDYGCCHLVARRLVSSLRVASYFVPISHFTDTKRVVNAIVVEVKHTNTCIFNPSLQ